MAFRYKKATLMLGMMLVSYLYRRYQEKKNGGSQEIDEIEENDDESFEVCSINRENVRCFSKNELQNATFVWIDCRKLTQIQFDDVLQKCDMKKIREIGVIYDDELDFSCIKFFPKLRSLTFNRKSGNCMIPVDSIRDLKELRELTILGEKIKNLPKQIFELTELEYLRICAEKKSSFPSLADFSNMKKLQTLEISGFHLKTLPNGIENLDELVSLYLMNNELVQLPSKLANLKKLQTLDISNNRFRRRPKILFELEKQNNITIEERENQYSKETSVVNAPQSRRRVSSRNFRNF